MNKNVNSYTVPIFEYLLFFSIQNYRNKKFSACTNKLGKVKSNQFQKHFITVNFLQNLISLFFYLKDNYEIPDYNPCLSGTERIIKTKNKTYEKPIVEL